MIYCGILWYTVIYCVIYWPKFFSLLPEFWIWLVVSKVSRHNWHWRFTHDLFRYPGKKNVCKERSWERQKISLVPRLPFGTHLFYGRGRRANELDSAGLTQLSKVLVLREKAIPRVDSLRGRGGGGEEEQRKGKEERKGRVGITKKDQQCLFYNP